MILYGRNPVREALRGRRAVRRVWASRPALRERGLARTPRPAGDATPDELERLCGSREHQGICAEADAYPYADADSLLRPDDAIVVCLDEVQDPHNLGAVCRVAEATGCRRGGHPGAPRRGGHSGGLQGVGRRGRASGGGARAQPGRLAGRGEGARRVGLRGRDRPRAPFATTRPTTRDGWCSCSARRGAGCAEGSPRAAIS